VHRGGQHPFGEHVGVFEAGQGRVHVGCVLLVPENQQPHLLDEHVARLVCRGDQDIAHDELGAFAPLLLRQTLESMLVLQFAHRVGNARFEVRKRQWRAVRPA
jgi:hypothetical protein